MTGFSTVVTERGGDPEMLLDRHHLDPALLHDPTGSIDFNDLAALLEHTAEYLDHPHLGTELARFQNGPMLMDPLESLLRAASTVGDVYRYGSRYMHVYTSAIQVHLAPLPETDQIMLRFEVLADDVYYRRQVMEQLVAVAHDDALSLSGGVARSNEIWFAHEALASRRAYHRRFGTTVRFSEPFDALLFNSPDLRAKVLSFDKEVQLRSLNAASADYPYEPQVCREVKRLLNQSNDLTDCTRDGISDALDLHPRALHRRLQKEGKTFDGIKDEVRRNRAAHYLAQSDAPLADVSARLGFAELAVLSRACRRWFGCSPRELRRLLAAGPIANGI